MSREELVKGIYDNCFVYNDIDPVSIEEVADYIEQVEREAIAKTIEYIGHNEGWEETKDFYIKELLKEGGK